MGGSSGYLKDDDHTPAYTQGTNACPCMCEKCDARWCHLNPRDICSRDEPHEKYCAYQFLSHQHPQLDSRELVPGEIIAFECLSAMCGGPPAIQPSTHKYHCGIYAGLLNCRPVVISKHSGGIIMRYLACDVWHKIKRMEELPPRQRSYEVSKEEACKGVLTNGLKMYCRQLDIGKADDYVYRRANCHHFVNDCYNGTNIAFDWPIDDQLAKAINFCG